jgi:hypothetical protein
MKKIQTKYGISDAELNDYRKGGSTFWTLKKK